MFGVVNYQTFLFSGILLNLTPGNDIIYVLSKTTTGGRKIGMASTLGIATGILIHTLLAALGLSAILAQSALAFRMVKLAGSVYLMVMGIRTLLSKGSLFETRDLPAGGSWLAYRQGVLTNLLNPKVSLFFLAFLPQFVSPEQPFGPLPFILLGLTFTTTGTIWCLINVYVAGFFSRLLTKNPSASFWANKATGLIYILLGLNILRAKQA